MIHHNRYGIRFGPWRYVHRFVVLYVLQLNYHFLLVSYELFTRIIASYFTGSALVNFYNDIVLVFISVPIENLMELASHLRDKHVLDLCIKTLVAATNIYGPCRYVTFGWKWYTEPNAIFLVTLETCTRFVFLSLYDGCYLSHCTNTLRLALRQVWYWLAACGMGATSKLVSFGVSS